MKMKIRKKAICSGMMAAIMAILTVASPLGGGEVMAAEFADSSEFITQDSVSSEENLISEENNTNAAGTYEDFVSEEATASFCDEDGISAEEDSFSDSALTVGQVTDNGIVDGGTCGENVTWTLTGTETTGYTLIISGNGTMTDFYGSHYTPWDKYKAYITSVVVGTGVKSFGKYAFEDCTTLTSISIPDSVVSIGACAFDCCTSLENINIPDSVVSIGVEAFKCCTRLKNINIPDSVTSIGGYAFCDCKSLTSIRIPDSVIRIEASVFEGCTDLVNVSIPTSIIKIEDRAFYMCSSLKSISIPSSVISIGRMAFSSCVNLTNISIPDSVTSIGVEAFRTCKSLASINIPESITSIEYETFSMCSGLKSIRIPNSVVTIGEYAFCECTGLESINIPNSISNIGNGAFKKCTNLTDIYYEGKETEWAAITIGYDNDPLSTATRHYNSKTQDKTDINTSTEPFLLNLSASNSVSGNYAVLGETCGLNVQYTAAVKGQVTEEAKQLVFTSSDPTIAEMNYSGGLIEDVDYNSGISTEELKVYKPGTVTITGTSPDGRTASITITVVPKLTVPSSIELNEETAVEFFSISLKEADAEFLQNYMEKIEVGFYTAEKEYLEITDNYVKVSDDGLSAKAICVLRPLQKGTIKYTVTLPEGLKAESKVQIAKWGFVSPDDEWSFGNYAIKGTAGTPFTEEDASKLFTGMDESMLRYLCDLIFSAEGQCYGMAASSFLVNKEILSLDSIENGITCLSQAQKTSNAKSKIAYYYLNQYTDAVENEYKIFSNLSVEKQLETIRTSSFPAILSFGCDENGEQKGWGHAILAYGVEYGKWSYNGFNYGIRVLTYDSNMANYPNWKVEDSYLYFNKGTSKWIIPNYAGGGASSEGKGYLKRILTDTDMISNFSASSFSSDVVRTYVTNSSFDMQYTLADGTTSKSCKVTGAGSSLNGDFTAFYEDDYNMNGSGSPNLHVWFNSLSSCTISPSTENKALNCGILFSDKYLEAEADTYKSVSLTEQGSVTLEGASGDYSIGITADEGTALAGKTIEISGNDSDKISAEVTDEGIVVSGDNLENVVVAEVDNNNTEAEKVSFHTEQDSVMITKRGDTMAVLEDTDGDGSYNETIAVGSCNHQWLSWNTTAEATVSQAVAQERICAVCGIKETRSYGTKLQPTIKVTAAKVPLKVNQSTTKLKVSGLAAGDKVTSWKSSNKKIVKVSSSGKLTAGKKTGKATVTITLVSGLTKKVTVTVQKNAVKTTKISGISKSLSVKKGSKTKLKPVITPITSLQKVTYTSSNRNVAAVSAKGVITAKKKGTAKITVRSGSKKIVVTVKVK